MIFYYLNENDDVRVELFNGLPDFLRNVEENKNFKAGHSHIVQSGEFCNDTTQVLANLKEMFLAMNEEELGIDCGLKPIAGFKGTKFWKDAIQEWLKKNKPDALSESLVEDVLASLDDYETDDTDAVISAAVESLYE